MSFVKTTLTSAIAAPGIRHGLRWFLHRRTPWRDFVHRKVAKRARFGDRTFTYQTPERIEIRLLHGGTSNYLYWLDEYEPETLAVFRVLASRATVILDIGAAEGLYAILAAAANPNARILAFEPGQSAAAVAGRNIALNAAITAGVELHTLALGDVDETATLYVAGRTGGTSSLNPAFRAQREEQSVQVRRGDALLTELGIDRVDLIKIDTESTEPTVLAGLLGALRAHHPDLICEVLRGRTEAALEALLTPLGYRFFWINEGGLVAHDHVAGDPTYRHPNYLFTTRADHELRALGLLGS